MLQVSPACWHKKETNPIEITSGEIVQASLWVIQVANLQIALLTSAYLYEGQDWDTQKDIAN